MSDNKRDFQEALKGIRAVMAKHDQTCPVTNRIPDGEGALRCALELGHKGEHMCIYTPHSAYLRRVAERIAENLCVHNGEVAWKSSEDNLIQGWEDDCHPAKIDCRGLADRTRRARARDLFSPFSQLASRS